MYTFDAFFHEQLTYEQKLLRAEEYDRIIIDEYYTQGEGGTLRWPWMYQLIESIKWISI